MRKVDTMRESKNLEFKEMVSGTYLKTVSAFANYGDGEILFGVSDDGKAVGLVFMKKIRFVDKVELLGYHTMAVEKYGKLGITYRLKGVPPMDSAKLMELQKLIRKPAEAVTRMSL